MKKKKTALASSQFPPDLKVGYLGGGQLAQMLSESASKMGLKTFALSENPEDPVARVTGNWIQGSPKSSEDLEPFLSQVDVATFESEFLNAEQLVEVQKKTKTRLFPAPQLMGLLQDRKSQKELFDRYHLPTSPWEAVDTTKAVLDFLDRHTLPVVFKKRFFGYDGYGTFIVKTRKQLNDFLKKHFKPNLFIVEKFIPFKKECAVIIARSQDESFTHFPFVESFQKDARCDWVKGPLKNSETQKMLTKLKKFLKHLHYVGVMGVEFFMTRSGLVINEIAPRVHNTGHYSQDTLSLSQFDVHNMCLLGLKLPKKIEIKGGFAMANLIGSGQKVALSPVENLHWYGKMENRSGRKMGHINAVGKNPAEALKKALKARKDIQL